MSVSNTHVVHLLCTWLFSNCVSCYTDQERKYDFSSIQKYAKHAYMIWRQREHSSRNVTGLRWKHVYLEIRCPVHTFYIFPTVILLSNPRLSLASRQIFPRFATSTAYSDQINSLSSSQHSLLIIFISLVTSVCFKSLKPVESVAPAAKVWSHCNNVVLEFSVLVLLFVFWIEDICV